MEELTCFGKTLLFKINDLIESMMESDDARFKLKMPANLKLQKSSLQKKNEEQDNKTALE